MLEQFTGIDVEEFLPTDFELNDILDIGGGSSRPPKYKDDDDDDEVESKTEVHFPIQHLYVPPNYYDVKYEQEEYRIPSEEFKDWYMKGSAGYLEDYYNPPHYTWNPDYYYFFGNLYKKWYPNVNDISHVPERRMPYWFGEVYY
jgi:hypothetical protein